MKKKNYDEYASNVIYFYERAGEAGTASLQILNLFVEGNKKKKKNRKENIKILLGRFQIFIALILQVRRQIYSGIRIIIITSVTKGKMSLFIIIYYGVSRLKVK